MAVGLVYAEMQAAAQAAADAVRRAGATMLVLSTDRDWLRDIVRFVVTKRRKR